MTTRLLELSSAAVSSIAAVSSGWVGVDLHNLLLHGHSATAAVQELRPAALRSELAYRALRVLDSSPLAGSGSLSKNFLSWQRGHAATWEQRTFAPFGMCPD
jgi:hypothetical protein